jgi:hypothetical protein
MKINPGNTWYLTRASLLEKLANTGTRFTVETGTG